MVTEKRTVLFLCTGNSARSQMAEALVNARLGDRWQAQSAGVEPTGRVNPGAIQALAEIGIQHAGESKHVNLFLKNDFDLVVTVCDDAAENCPVWLGKGKREHLSFPDPAKVNGSDEEKLEAFRQVLSDISVRIPALLLEKERGLLGGESWPSIGFGRVSR
ncbi:MAG: arsenate reductase ArsC [Anaerolineales bacterium]